MGLLQMLDHATTAVARMLSQYRSLPRMSALIAELGGRGQDVENALWAFVAESDVDTADGIWLDYWGAFVGEARQGTNDATYRNLIKARVLANSSNGTVEDLIAIARTALGLPGLNPVVTEWVIASLTLQIPSTTTVDDGEDIVFPHPLHLRTRLVRLLGAGKAAGVKLSVITSPVGVGIEFECGNSANPQPELDADKGLGDSTDPSVGGFLISSDDAH